MDPILDSTPHNIPRNTPEPNSPLKEPLIFVKHAPENGSVIKRLQAELLTLMMSTTPGISAFPNSDTDLMHWTGTITGPVETPYSGMTFRLSFEFPAAYPYVPPVVVFKTPIYHPNIDFSGRICLDILKEKWSAIYNVQSVLLSLQSLLGEPNNSSPLNGQAAELWHNDMVEYTRLVVARHVEPVDDLMDED